MPNKYTVKTTDASLPAVTFQADSFVFGGGKFIGGTTSSASVSGAPRFSDMYMTFKPGSQGAAYLDLLRSVSTGQSYDSVTLEIRDDLNRLVERVTITNAFATSLSVGSSGDAGGSATLSWLFGGIKAEFATTPGGPLDAVFEDNNVQRLNPPPAKHASTVFAPGADYAYLLKVDGHEIALNGYELDLSKPVDPSTGLPTGATSTTPLLLHLAEAQGSAETDWLLGAARNNVSWANAIVEVRNGDGNIVQSLALTGASVQSEAIAEGLGKADAVVALNFATLIYGNYTNLGSGAEAPDDTVTLEASTNDAPGTIGLHGQTLAEIGAQAQVAPGGSATLTLTNAPGSTIALKGIELDFAHGDTNIISPLIGHLGGEPLSAGAVKLFQALASNAGVGTGSPADAIIEYKDENGALVKRLTLTGAHLVGESLAGGQGGGDGAFALVYDSVTLATASTPAARSIIRYNSASSRAVTSPPIRSASTSLPSR